MGEVDGREGRGAQRRAEGLVGAPVDDLHLLVGERDDFFDTDTPDKLFRTSLDFNIWTKGT